MKKQVFRGSYNIVMFNQGILLKSEIADRYSEIKKIAILWMTTLLKQAASVYRRENAYN